MKNCSASAGCVWPNMEHGVSYFSWYLKKVNKKLFCYKKIFEVLETNLHMSDPSLGSDFLILAWPQSVGFQTWLDFFLSQFSRSMQIFKVIKYFLQHHSLSRIHVGQKQEKRNKGCLGSQREEFEGMTMGTFCRCQLVGYSELAHYCPVETAPALPGLPLPEEVESLDSYMDCFDL